MRPPRRAESRAITASEAVIIGEAVEEDSTAS